MRIVFPEASEFLPLVGQLEDWSIVIVPKPWEQPPGCQRHWHWLGSSVDGRVWGLGVDSGSADDESDLAEAGSVVQLLLDPPKREPAVIQEILLRAHIEAEEGGLTPERAAAICDTAEFPTYRTVREYLPEAPEEWLDLPVKITLGIGLCDTEIYSPETFETYARDSLRGVVETVCGTRQEGLVLAYQLEVQGLVPMLGWDVDWPLSRRGRNGPSRRTKVQGSVPWEWRPDPRLLVLYQDVPIWIGGGACLPHYWAQHVPRLVVGGRTREGAVANWHRCARALRAMKRQAAREGTLIGVRWG